MADVKDTVKTEFKKGFKDMIIQYVKGLSQEMIGEYFGYGMLKNLLKKTTTGGPATTTGGGGTPEHERHVDVVWGGLFNLSDEAAYFSLAGKMFSKEEAKAYSKINSFVKTKLTEKWQKKRFRLVLGYLSEIEYEIKEVLEPSREIPQKGKPPIKVAEKVKVTKLNLAVQTIKSLVQLTDDQIHDICEAAGILEPPIVKKVQTYLGEHEEDLLEQIGELRSKIPTPSRTSQGRAYQGFFKEVLGTFGIKKNN